MLNFHALIISRRIIAAHQLASLLKTNGFTSQVEYNGWKALKTHPTRRLDLLITDIDDPQIQAIHIANLYRNHQPGLAWFALSQGGNTPAMRDARSFMVGGFFFLMPSGLERDKKRGAARFLCENNYLEEQESTKHPTMPSDAFVISYDFLAAIP